MKLLWVLVLRTVIVKCSDNQLKVRSDEFRHMQPRGIIWLPLPSKTLMNESNI
jgi:hypothetical protein